MTLQYQVLITPLLRPNVYGSTVDVTQDVDLSEWIEQDRISSINSEVDQGDYDIGIYTYGSVTFKAINFDGRFNEPQVDSRSMFPWYRDRAKVDINFIGDSTVIQFRGLITDKATKQDLSKQTVSFTALSQDSIFQQLKVSSGTVLDGMTFTEAFQAMLNISEVTNILNFSIANINPLVDLTVDDGSKFNSVILKTALGQLLFAANSVLVIDSSKNIIARSRTENSNTPHRLYLNDTQGRDNIDTITNYNNGLQRMFNSIFVNTTESVNQNSIDTFFVRQKTQTLAFITDTTSQQTIADSIISNFGVPLTEMMVLTDTETAESMNILDKITVKKNLRLSRAQGKHIALYDVDDYEKSYYAIETGDLELIENVIYKIVGFFKNPATFKTAIKIRATGEIV